MRARILIPLLVLAAACGGSDDGVKPPDPSRVTIVYSPDPGEIVRVVPDSVTLSVSVTPQQAFEVQYLVGDSLVHVGAEFKIMGDRVSEARYRAVVRVEDDWYDDDWLVRFVANIDLPTPPPTAPVASPGDLPGTVTVRWDRPSIDQIDEEAPLEGFEIAWSTSPFEAEEFDAQEIAFVEDRPGIIRQTTDVGGLAESQLHYLRIRSVDVLGRNSWPTSQVASMSTGSFELSGTVWQLDENGWPAPVSSVLVEAGPRRVTTLEDGRFVLGSLPDLEPLALSAEEGSGAYTLPILTTPLQTLDRELDLVLVPRLTIDVLQEGVVSESTLHELLLEATRNDVPLPPYDFFGWEDYPVKVWVWDYTAFQDPGGNPSEDVHYHEAFATGIDRWNAGAVGDRRLLQYVPVGPEYDPTDDPDAVGVMIRLYDSPPPWSNFGEVGFVRPSNGSVGTAQPKVLLMQLRPTFLNQALADRIIAHELGHVLGLVHTRSEADLMHATSDLADGVPTEPELFVARYLRHASKDMKANWIVAP